MASFVSKFSDTVSSEIGKVSLGFAAVRFTLEIICSLGVHICGRLHVLCLKLS